VQRRYTLDEAVSTFIAAVVISGIALNWVVLSLWHAGQSAFSNKKPGGRTPVEAEVRFGKGGLWFLTLLKSIFHDSPRPENTVQLGIKFALLPSFHSFTYTTFPPQSIPTMRSSILALALGAALAAASDVHDLKTDTFEPFIKEHDLVLAECTFTFLSLAQTRQLTIP
jgi:hypothetical protein